MARRSTTILLTLLLSIGEGRGGNVKEMEKGEALNRTELHHKPVGLEKERRLLGLPEDIDETDDSDLHVNYLTTCIMPFRTYVPSEKNMYRIPYGNVRLTFDGGGGNFNRITRGTYPGYESVFEFTFQYDLQGLPSNCERCRIQVTEGTSCDAPGIRFWDRSVEGSENPWRAEWGATYTSNKHGIARGFFSMFDGFAFDDHKTRSVVVFDQDGKTRVGCGAIVRREYGECDMIEPDPSQGPTPGPGPTPEPLPTFPSRSPMMTPETSSPSTLKPSPATVPTATPIPPDPTNQPQQQPTSRPTPNPTDRPTPSPTEQPRPSTKSPASATPNPASSGKGGGKMGMSSSKKSKKTSKRRRIRAHR